MHIMASDVLKVWLETFCKLGKCLPNKRDHMMMSQKLQNIILVLPYGLGDSSCVYDVLTEYVCSYTVLLHSPHEKQCVFPACCLVHTDSANSY